MKNYIAYEELYYSLSFILERDLTLKNKRLKYFADFIENLVFSNYISIDKPDESSTSREKLYLQLINFLGLDSVIKLENFEFSQSDELHVLNKFNSTILSDAFNSLEKESERVNFINEQFSSIINVVSNMDHDFLSFYLDIVHDFNFKITETEIQEFSDILSVDKELIINGFDFLHRKDDPKEFFAKNIGLLSQYMSAYMEICLQIAQEHSLNFIPMKNYSTIIQQKPFYNYSKKIFLNKLQDLITEEEIKIYDLYVENHSFTYKQPLIFDYIISKASSNREIVEIALELRESKEILEFHNWCKSVDEALRNGMRKEANSMIKECEEFIQSLKRKTKVERKTSIRITFPPALIVDLKKSDFIVNEHKFTLLKDIYDNTLTSHHLIKKLQNMK